MKVELSDPADFRVWGIYGSATWDLIERHLLTLSQLTWLRLELEKSTGDHEAELAEVQSAYDETVGQLGWAQSAYKNVAAILKHYKDAGLVEANIAELPEQFTIGPVAPGDSITVPYLGTDRPFAKPLPPPKSPVEQALERIERIVLAEKTLEIERDRDGNIRRLVTKPVKPLDHDEQVAKAFLERNGGG